MSTGPECTCVHSKKAFQCPFMLTPGDSVGAILRIERRGKNTAVKGRVCLWPCARPHLPPALTEVAWGLRAGRSLPGH